MERTIFIQMANFDESVNKVLKWEGGYQTNPNDYGNYNSAGELVGTKYGITPTTFFLIKGYEPTAQDMQNLTKDEAKTFYYTYYWYPNNLQLIKSQKVANFILDTLVLFSSQTAHKILHYAGNYIDINYYNSIPEVQALEEIAGARIGHFNNIVTNDPTQAQFLQGWTNRTEDYINTSIFDPILTEVKQKKSILFIGSFALLLFAVFDHEKKRK